MSAKDALRLLCPHCHADIGSGSRPLEECKACGTRFPVVRGVPILRLVDDGEQLDYTDASSGLPVQDSGTLSIPFVQEALRSDKLVLELGAGVDNYSSDHLVKTDAYLYSSDLDYIADAHSLPFASESFDYVFSLAVFEHLHSPWLAAEEIFRVLRRGGKVYVLTAFHQHVHGYPSHFFNMTDMGLKRIFERFEIVHLAPSKHSSLNQIAYSLVDLVEMVQAAGRKKPRDDQTRLDFRRLEVSLSMAVALLPELSDELIGEPEAAAAWGRIAPAFELIGTKPLAP